MKLNVISHESDSSCGGEYKQLATQLDFWSRMKVLTLMKVEFLAGVNISSWLPNLIFNQGWNLVSFNYIMLGLDGSNIN